jgi:hypothetical protein
MGLEHRSCEAAASVRHEERHYHSPHSLQHPREAERKRILSYVFCMLVVETFSPVFDRAARISVLHA